MQTYEEWETEHQEPRFEVSWYNEEPYRECTRTFKNEDAAEKFCKEHHIQNYQIMFWGY